MIARRRTALFLILVLPALLFTAAPASADEAGKARQAIMDADILFAHSLKDQNLERFREFISEETLFFGSSEISHGRDAVARAWRPFFEPGATATLAWEPVRAEVASSADLGYTVGNYTLKTLDGEGNTKVQHGAYVTIWRREEGGVWRAALDIGTHPGAAPLVVPED